MIKAVIFDMYETLITHYECPLYFSAEMALDAGVEEERFRNLWRSTEDDRTTGKVTFEGILERILKENGCYSENKMNYIVEKRIRCKEESFEHLHSEIIPMLNSLKERGILIGLISNCFSEESVVIKKSILYPYFDAACLSFDEGMKKPDRAIFERCLEKLKVKPEECLYVGDGGSCELEAAETVGMKAVLAVWYLKEGTNQTSTRKAAYANIETPLGILSYL